MSVARWAMKRRSFTLFVAVLLALGGAWAYLGLGRLEDPDFTVKTALVVTVYSGASPMEVEEEVTDEVEQAIQRLPQLKRVRSRSERGLSVVYVDIKDDYSDELPQVWDELRRKVKEAQRHLPPGSGPSMVNDDFGDVFGVVFAVTGDGYSLAELKRHAEDIKKILLLVPDVAQVSLWGDRTEAVFVEISRARMAELGISPEQIAATLQGQNLEVDSGSVMAGSLRVPIDPSGNVNSVESIGDLLIRGASAGRLIYLKDVAQVSRGYLDPPSRMMSYDGTPAIAIGVSTVPGGNVVRMGEMVRRELERIREDLPLGVEVETVTFQSDLVKDAVRGFVLNLAEAVAIVVGLLVVFMGITSGLLMGVILLLTIAGTFIAMRIMGIDLHSVSLGALIICLGMLVDNAIVVTEGILVGISSGEDGEIAADRVVDETKWPLLGATVVAILAFSAIGLSKDVTGEFCRSLFQVVAASLLLSWLLAITVTPVLAVMFLTPEIDDENGGRSRFRRFYRGFLSDCVERRWITLGIMAAMLLLALWGFRFVGQSFFPDMVRDQFMIHYRLPESTDVTETDGDLREISRYLLESESSVESVASFSGEGPLRFYLAFEPELPDSSYGFILVTVDDYDEIGGIIARQSRWIAERFPDSEPRFERFKKGPSTGAEVKLRITGDDPSVLRALSERVKVAMAADPDGIDVRDDWRQRVKVLVPEVDEARARRAGLTRGDVASSLKGTFDGRTVGVYREGDELLPIKLRVPEAERADLDSAADVQVWSRGMRRFVPIGQVISNMDLLWEDPLIWRRNRSRVITPQCDSLKGSAEDLRRRLVPTVEALELPDGYDVEWGGEYEDSRTSQEALVGPFLLSLVFMVIVVMGLFNGFRQPAAVFLCLPLAAIGVTSGLLITGRSFGFMALLGYLSLIGMLIKNAIVLLDQIELDMAAGKPRFSAVLDASTGRVRPVMMAAMTTVLGMVPLALDDFFASMAVTIMFGLSFATVLTLVVVPVMYCAMYGISSEETSYGS